MTPSFSVSTWNCFGMGQGLSAVAAIRAPHAERLRDREVLAECAAADILCLQELLSREAQAFFDGVGKGHFTSRFRDHNRIRLGRSVTMRGCGLGIGARKPLTKTLVRAFPGMRAGWDRLARKGALYTQLSVRPGIEMDLITVHLQAGHDARAAAVRAVQLADLKELIEAVGSPDRPFVVCGDFNIDGLAHARDRAEYQSLLMTLQGFEDLGAETDRPTFDAHPEGNALAHAFEPDGSALRIDYIFFRPARGSGALRCTKLDLFFDTPLAETPRRDGSAGWASDHYGLRASFVLDR